MKKQELAVISYRIIEYIYNDLDTYNTPLWEDDIEEERAIRHSNIMDIVDHTSMRIIYYLAPRAGVLKQYSEELFRNEDLKMMAFDIFNKAFTRSPYEDETGHIFNAYKCAAYLVYQAAVIIREESIEAIAGARAEYESRDLLLYNGVLVDQSDEVQAIYNLVTGIMEDRDTVDLHINNIFKS